MEGWSGSQLRSVYTGNSRTTRWRQEQIGKAKTMSVQSNRKITEWCKSNDPVEKEPATLVADKMDVLGEIAEMPSISIDVALEMVKNFTKVIVSQQNENVLAKLSKYDHIRYLALEQYFYLLKSSKNMMSSSKIVCPHIHPNQSENYHSRRIRFWAEHFRKHGELPVHRRGCHVKVKSFIHEEDIARHCRLWLRSQNHNSISAHGFCQWTTKDLHVKAGLPSPIVVSQSTATRWLHTLGMKCGVFKMGLYKDGHERADVDQYREGFLQRMVLYDKRMIRYEDSDDDKTMNVIQPDLEQGHKRLVLVAHDESCFSSNKGKSTTWLDEENRPIRPKGEGRSIMVSEFFCECHGPLN
jgi:hypothetical protein